jgi:hypothetical protein
MSMRLRPPGMGLSSVKNPIRIARQNTQAVVQQPRFGAVDGEIPRNRLDFYYPRHGDASGKVDDEVSKLGLSLQSAGYKDPDREILRLMGAMIRHIPPQNNERKQNLTAMLQQISPDIELSEVDQFPSAFGHYINVHPEDPDNASRRELDKAIAGLSGKIMGPSAFPDARIMRAMVILGREINRESIREEVIDGFLKVGTPKEAGIAALLSALTLADDRKKTDKLRRFADAYSLVYMRDSDYRLATVRVIGSLADRGARSSMLLAAQNDSCATVRIAADRALQGDGN